MADTIRIIAHVAMDMFYQDYKPAESFLQIKHFVFLAIAADAKLKQDDYDKQVNLNLRQRKPNATVSLAYENYTTVTVPIKKNIATLPTDIMMFSGADQSISVSQVEPEGGCGDFMPLLHEEKWQAKDIKGVVFWLMNCNGLEFVNLEQNCNPKNVTVTYIPQLVEKSKVQASRKMAILNMVNIYIKSAKEGVIINMSNDGNPNSASQTEINKYLLTAMKNK